MLAVQKNKRRRRMSLPLARVTNAGTSGVSAFYVYLPLASIRCGISVAAEGGAGISLSSWTITPQRYNPDSGQYTDLQVPSGRSSAQLADGYSVEGSPEVDRLRIDVTWFTSTNFGTLGGRFAAVVTWEADPAMSIAEWETEWKPHCDAVGTTELAL